MEMRVDRIREVERSIKRMETLEEKAFRGIHEEGGCGEKETDTERD